MSENDKTATAQDVKPETTPEQDATLAAQESKATAQAEAAKQMKIRISDSFTDFVVKGIASPTFAIGEIPQQVRLAFVQITRSDFRSEIKIGDNKVPYLKGDKAKRMLSFVTNFGWGVEDVSDEKFEEFKTTTTKKKKNSNETYQKEIVRYEASCRCKFWYMWDGEKRVHSCRGSFKAYANPATSKFSVMQMAQTNATKTFAADVFGIGADLKDAENQAFNDIRRASVKEDWDEFQVPEIVDEKSDHDGLEAVGDL